MKILSHNGVIKRVVDTKLNATQVGQYICEMQSVTIKGKLKTGLQSLCVTPNPNLCTFM